MTVKERILALRLLEKQEKMTQHFRDLGIHTYVAQEAKKEDKNV